MRKRGAILISIVIFMFSNTILAITPPPSVDEITVILSRDLLPNDNTTICNITVIPLDINGDPIDAIVWFSSSLHGTYLNGEKHPPGSELAIPTHNGKAYVSLTADTVGNTTVKILCGGTFKNIVIQIVEAPGNPPPPPPCFTFDLKRGWNLIFLPIKTPYQSAEDLGKAIQGCDTICMWAGTSWICHPIGGPANFDLQDEKSYFIHVLYDTVFTIYGLPYESLYVNLYPGINTIGWLKETSITAEELGTSIVNCSDISKWDAENQRWITHPIGGPNNFIITRGTGLLIFVTSHSVWEYPL